MPNVIMLSVVIIRVVMNSAFILSVVMLTVTAPAYYHRTRPRITSLDILIKLDMTRTFL